MIGQKPPVVGTDWKRWAISLNQWLSQWMHRLQWYGGNESASENGAILWDDARGAPVVSRADEWQPLAVTNIIYVSSKADFPAPVGNVITLQSGSTYVMTESVDLGGDRLVFGDNAALHGVSQYIVALSSTGLTEALITATGSILLNRLTLTASTALDLNNSGSSELKWLNVHFLNCPVIGSIQNYQTVVIYFTNSSNSANLTLDGTIDVIVFDTSGFTGIAGQETIIIPSTATIARRFRASNVAFIAPSGATSISFDVGASVPDESYVLQQSNFSGAGTAISGIPNTDTRALFSGNIGVPDTTEIASYYMSGNATATTITATDTPVKASGSTSSEPITQKFTNTTNRATYIGAIERNFKVHAVAACSSNNSNVIAVYVAKNGVVVSQSEGNGTANSGGRAEGVMSAAVISLEANDYVEVWVANKTGANDITVETLHMMVTEV